MQPNFRDGMAVTPLSSSRDMPMECRTHYTRQQRCAESGTCTNKYNGTKCPTSIDVSFSSDTCTVAQ
eukprot:6208704-Pleurochrysis_carterae.AAC.6